MPQLQRLTTMYVPAEDRLRLTGVDQCNSLHALWVTHRMAVQLVAQLFKHTDIPAQKVALAPYADAVKAMQFDKAKSMQSPTPPVQPPAEEPGWLVHTITLRRTSPILLVICEGNEGHQAEIPLTPVLLNQWLGVLYTNFKRAGWAMDNWPHWFLEAQRPVSTPAAALH